MWLDDCREGMRLEAKEARAGVPKSFWDTYSAFANTDGGTVLLGVAEDGDGRLFACGVEQPERMVKELWDAVNDAQRVSANVLAGDGIRVEQIDGLPVVVVEVPRAERFVRPVYVRGNPRSGTYRRNGEGDYHCSEEEYRAMVRDSSEGAADRLVLDGVGRDALCAESVEGYRRELALVRPRNPWHRLPTDEFLVKLGALGRSGADGALHPTRAGLLMFGYECEITGEFPYYFLDYREVHDGRRWSDRVVSNDGEWSGNLYDFWHRVYPRLVADLRKPFGLDADGRRVEDTPLHGALREALANALVHADYYGRRGTTVVRRPAVVEFANPGSLRLPVDVVLAGGVSDARNPTLMKMFQLLSYVEKAGSGFDGMRWACEWAGLPCPELREEFGPDVTHLTLWLGAPEDACAGRTAGDVRTSRSAGDACVERGPVEVPEARRCDVSRAQGCGAAGYPAGSPAPFPRVRIRSITDVTPPASDVTPPASDVTLPVSPRPKVRGARERREAIISYIIENGSICRSEAAELLAVKPATAKVVLSKLASEGAIELEGGGRGACYRLVAR